MTNAKVSVQKCSTPLKRVCVCPQVSDRRQSVSEILQQLQEVKGEAASTKEELKCYRELSHKLQEDIEVSTDERVMRAFKVNVLCDSSCVVCLCSDEGEHDHTAPDGCHSGILSNFTSPHITSVQR